ncbi:MAG: hypothetical protein HYZ31_01510 [Gammaproteobacteria bacterium]|nr:hypothetical protein [Gammaproteobacteria bacterium]
MSIYTANIQKMETQLNVWNAQIKLLEARIASTSTNLKLLRARELNELRAQQRAAADILKEMKNATSEAWGEAKATADKIWDDLKIGIAAAHTEIK